MNQSDLQLKLNQANQYFNQQEFSKASQLYLQLINENPQLKSNLSIRLAHCLILEANWQQISGNLIQGINYLSTSGWLNSLFQGKPVNAESKPIPWYTYPAIEFLEDKIKPDSIVFEFGGGNSTLWWASKAKQVISIESDQGWYDQIKQQMPNNVQLNLEVDETKYADFINQYPDQYFDVIIVDGINRNSCLENSLNKLKNDGLLIFDNTDDHRYNLSLKLLSSQGYKRIDFYGLVPSYTYKNCTSLFFKSTEILETTNLPSDKQSCLGKSCFQITSPKIETINSPEILEEKTTLNQEKTITQTPQEITDQEQKSLNKFVCVDLGCGTHKAEGFIGVDIVSADGVDVVADLSETFPFPDNSVDVIKAHDFIEHLPNRIQTMNELWRILKPNGVVDIFVPSTDGRGAFQDPTHVSYWNINSFMYYCKEYPAYLAGCQSHYGFKGEFSIINIREVESSGKVIHVRTQLRAIKPENSYFLNLRDFNILFFPDWSQTQEIIYEQLQTISQVIIESSNSVNVSLSINIQDSKIQEIDLFLSDFLLNLYLEYESANLPEFNILKTNSIKEYTGLNALINYLIISDSNQDLILSEIGLDQIPYCTLNNFDEHIIKI